MQEEQPGDHCSKEVQMATLVHTVVVELNGTSMAKITEESEMAKRGTSDSESEDASVSGSESEETHTMGNGKKGVTEYEKQRLSRIAENRARLEALGLPKMALSLKSSHLRTAKKGKEKVKEDDDEEYVPEDEGGPGSSSSSDHDEDSKDEDFATKNSSGSRKRMVGLHIYIYIYIFFYKCCFSDIILWRYSRVWL